MIPVPLQTLFIKRILIVHQNCFRYVRNIALRDVAPNVKLVKGKVKTVDEYDDSPGYRSYKEFLTEIKNSDFGDQLEVEKQFLNEDYHGDVFEKCDKYYDMHLSEEKQMRSLVKKKIISHKYFKLDKETTLLTHAAKEQIRYLHKSNPTVWNHKTLSECFPVTEKGVKKLLRSNFVLTCPEQIKQHDKEVAQKWEILKSGKFSDKIAPLTQELYNKGKLVDDYSSGNPNLPTEPPTNKKIIEIKKTEKIGEFSNIVKSYIDYQKQNLVESGKDNSCEKQLSLRDNRNISKNRDFKFLKEYKYASEELDHNNVNPEVYPPPQRKIKYDDDDDMPFSQFKEILKEETSYKQKSKHKNEYDDFVLQETSKTEEATGNKPVYAEDCFFPIPKYEKESVSGMYERNRTAKSVYKYDEKLGYQYPVGKNIKGRIKIPSEESKKGKPVKVGQCVYDADGEFLYKV